MILATRCRLLGVLVIAILVGACAQAEQAPVSLVAADGPVGDGLAASSAAGAAHPDAARAARVDEPAREADVAPPAPSLDGTTLRLEHPALRWSEGPPATGYHRQALLVAADRYDESNWDLPYARPTADALRDVLVDALAFDADDVTLLSGDRVYSDNVRATIRRLTRDMSGPGNVLLVHWVGHGFNIDGQQRFLTWPSRLGDGGYTSTLAYDALTTWLADAKRDVQERGGELSVALIVDACRTRTSAAPGRIIDHVPAADVEAFAASVGSPAAARATADLSVFTEALCRSLASAHDTRVGLRGALADAVAAARSQGAEITTGDSDVVLLDRADLALAVQAVDALSNRPLPGARVQLNGVERTGTGVFTGLTESAAGYDLRVLADGYFWRAETVRFDRTRSGDLLSVPLLPEFTALSGVLELDGPGVARVSVTGAFPGAIDGHHATVVTLDRSGPFHLRVPDVPGERTLVIEVNGVEVRRVPFDLGVRSSTLVEVDGTPVRMIDFGAHVVGPGRVRADLGAPVEPRVVGTIEVAFDLESLTRADFADERSWAYGTTLRTFLEEGRYEDAYRDTSALLASGRVSATGVRKLESLRRELDVARTMSAASTQRENGETSAAIDTLARSDVVADRRIRPVLVSWLREDARELWLAEERAGAVARLEQAQALEPGDAELRALLTQAHEDWLAHGFEVARTDGTWTALEQRLDAVRRHGTVDAGAWERRIRQESISPECRARYAAALAALANGELEQAWSSFGAALDSGCNAHYAVLIEEQRRPLADTLFAKYDAIGSERDTAGDPVAAFVAYAKAWEFDPLATPRVERFLELPAVIAAQPALVSAFAGRRDARAAVEAVDLALATGRADRADELLDAAREQPAVEAVEVARLEADLAALRARDASRREAERQRALTALGDHFAYVQLDRDAVQALRVVAEEQWPGILGSESGGAEFAFVDVRQFAAGGVAAWMAIYRHAATSAEFVLVPGGTVSLGSGSREAGRQKDEGPRHGVRLEPFLIARTEVTQATWARVSGGALPAVPATGDGLPVSAIDFETVMDWCAQAGLALPTEAQWEHACRAGTDGAWAFGARIDPSWANIESRGTLAVASYTPNAFGLYDTHGNVAEWCRDWFGSYVLGVRPRTGERLLGPSGLRVVRGGAFSGPSDRSRSAARTVVTPGSASPLVGLRPVRNLGD